MISKEEILAQFDPNSPGLAGQIFGLPFTEENAQVIIVPVPWEVTVSYTGGTATAPRDILAASTQVDLYMRHILEAWKLGIYMLPFPGQLLEESNALRKLAKQHIEAIEAGHEINPIILNQVNKACESLTVYVKNITRKYLRENKLVGVLGGDHSTPLGFIQALSEQHDRFGILAIDAHADLRKAYEGFTYSHASIMYNALKLPSVAKLVQVGIRDYCEAEEEIIRDAQGRIKVFYDEDIKYAQYQGKTWSSICEAIIHELPDKVYISLDIDGMDPKLCPHTGTPVAGGFDFHHITLLFNMLARSGKKIVGFDLNEVAAGDDDEWDANVGARLLYQLCNWTAVSQGKLHYRA